MIHKFLCAETEALSKKFLDGARTLEEWLEKRPRLHREYLDMLGLRPLPEKTPLKATVTGTLESQGAIIEKIHFQSTPGLYVTANLYRPASAERKQLPTILYVCGHANKGRDGNKSAYQDHGLWFANNGYNCLILDSHQLGEIPGVHHGTYGVPYNHLKAYGFKDKDPGQPRWWWHSAGFTPAGVECWNGIRAIDYLLTRADVDPDKIGVTGISGGGAATFWIAAADQRVKVAVPVSGMSDLESYVKNKIINGHCDCMFLYNTHQWDWTTIAALIAPRPLLFANSDNDPIFPMDGNRRIIEKLHTIYAKYGKSRLAEEYVSKGGHDYRSDLRIAIFKFFNKHLKNDPRAEVKDTSFEKIAGRDLRAFLTDDDIPKDSINARIDETFVPQAKLALPAAADLADWKRRLLEDLGRRIPRSVDQFAEVPHLLRDCHLVGAGKKHSLLYMEKDAFERIRDFKEFTRPFALKGDACFWFRPRFYPVDTFGVNVLDLNEPDRWTHKSPPNYVERSYALLGKTVDACKVAHLMAVARKLAQTPEGKYWDGRVVGQGATGILATYAALFENSIKEVVIVDPPTSHKDGPHFLSILRVLDIPDALGLLAPTPLTIINGQDKAFDRTAELYRLAGAADKLQRK